MHLNIKPTIKINCIAVVLCMLLTSAYGQDTHWNLVNGKASVQKTLSLPGKTSKQIYREVNRWLIMVYTNPEDILKARLDDEYLRGEASVPNCIMLKFNSDAGIQYTFSFEINEEMLVFKIYDVSLIHSNSQDDSGIFPIEQYISVKGKRKRDDAEHILASISEYTASMFKSLENHLGSETIY